MIVGGNVNGVVTTIQEEGVVGFVCRIEKKVLARLHHEKGVTEPV